jgi:hypothetical protein
MRKESAMTTVSRQTQVVTLAHQAMFDVSDASAVALRCDDGCVWITLDDDPRDIVLEAGESFETDEPRHAIVYALKPSKLTLRTPGETPNAPVRRRLQLAASPA